MTIFVETWVYYVHVTQRSLAMHALERINERYGNKFTIADINIITTLIKKGLYLEIVKDFVNRDKITILLRYNNTPLKIVYSKENKRIITVLPFDVDEYNMYYDLIPEINTDGILAANYESDVNKVRQKFEAGFCNKEIHRAFNLEENIRNKTKFYVRSTSGKFVILWFKKTKNSIFYQVYSKKSLQKRLWHFTIEGFRQQDSALLTNTVLLYAKIFK